MTQVTEETRRQLYDATVAVHFLLPDGTVQWAPYYDPDQAGLTVTYLSTTPGSRLTRLPERG